MLWFQGQDSRMPTCIRHSGSKLIRILYYLSVLIHLYRVSPQNVLPIGSDFPVEPANPLMGFYAAVTRLNPDGLSPHGPGGWSVAFSFVLSNQILTVSLTLAGMQNSD